jgi:hypothetical protein
MRTSTARERAAFLAGQGTLTADQCWTWARELDPTIMGPWDPVFPPEEPLMVHVLPREDHRGLLGAIIPSVVRRERRR